MQDKWGWELPQLSIDTCSGWQQQIEDWRCLCVWWKTNLKTYVFWESFEITVTINNFLSCSLMNWRQHIFTAWQENVSLFSFSPLEHLQQSYSVVFLFTCGIFLNLWKRFSLATTRLLTMNWNIMVTRGNVCLFTPTFSLASELNLQMKGSAKNMKHKLNTFWVEGAF